MNINDLKTKIYVWRLQHEMGEQLGSSCYIPYDSRIIGKEYINIGKNFYAYQNLRLEAFRVDELQNKNIIEIGNNVAVGNYCHIGAINKIIIGDNVLMGSNVLITDHMHGQVSDEEIKMAPNERKLYSKGAVIIEKNVFIGDGAKIMPGVKIGEGAIIGANAVITHNVNNYSVMAGIPATEINKLR